MRKDATFRAAYRRAGLITGRMGFRSWLACRLQGKPVSRVAGSDLIAPISAEAHAPASPSISSGPVLPVLTKTSRLLRERKCRPDDRWRFLHRRRGSTPTSEGGAPLHRDNRQLRGRSLLRRPRPTQAGAVCRSWEEPPAQHIVRLHWRRTRFHRWGAGARTALDAALGSGMAVARCQ